MGSKKKRCKFERTTQEQLEFFMQFCRKHPEILRGADKCPPALRESQHLWEEIAKNLNELRGPTRSVAKWRDTLLHWKSQFRHRMKKVIADCKDSRGVTNFEKRTFQTLEAVANDNFPAVYSLESEENAVTPLDDTKIKREVQITDEESMSPLVANCSISPEEPLSPSNFAPLKVECSLSPGTSVSFTSGSALKPKESTLEAILEVLKECEKSREERDERAIAQQAQMTAAFQQLSQSFMAMTQVLEKLNDKLVNLK